MDVVEQLRYARDRLAKRNGWRQGENGNFRDDREPCCVIRALDAICAGPEAFLYVAKAAGLGEGDELSAWNDTPGRTQGEIVAVIERAIGLATALQIGA